jgi:hypothetical protein
MEAGKGGISHWLQGYVPLCLLSHDRVPGRLENACLTQLLMELGIQSLLSNCTIITIRDVSTIDQKSMCSSVSLFSISRRVKESVR